MRFTFHGNAAWGLEVLGRRAVIDSHGLDDRAWTAIAGYAVGADLVHMTHGAEDRRGVFLELLRANPADDLAREPATIRNTIKNGVDCTTQASPMGESIRSLARPSSCATHTGGTLFFLLTETVAAP